MLQVGDRWPRAVAAEEEGQLRAAMAESLHGNEMRAAERARDVRVLEASSGKRLIAVVGDGNCLYRAVALALGREQDDFPDVKEHGKGRRHLIFLSVRPKNQIKPRWLHFRPTSMGLDAHTTFEIEP